MADERRAVLVVGVAEAAALESELGAAFDVLAVDDVGAAVVAIEKHAARICAVVSGLLLPTGDGTHQRPKAVWSLLPRVVRIILSTADETQTLTGVSAIVSAAVVLSKPWPTGVVLQALERALQT